MEDKRGVALLSVIPIRSHPSDQSEMVSQLLFGEAYSVLKEDKKWLEIICDYDKYIGFIDKKQFSQIDTISARNFDSQNNSIVFKFFKSKISGVGQRIISPGSIVPEHWMVDNLDACRHLKDLEPNINTIIEDAFSFLGVPYLWGGRSMFGIDCSGLMQIIHKINGIHLNRDAWQQEKSGELVSLFENHQKGDLAFFANEKGRIIHVGIISEQNKIIHASGWVKEDILTDEGIIDENGQISHKLHSVKRISQ